MKVNARSFLVKLLLLWVSLLPVLVFANAEVKGVRSWLAPDNTRLVFDLSGPVEHRLFTLSNPDRIVIDVSDTRLQTDFDQLSLDESPIDAIRYSHSEGTLRIVLDLKDQVRLRPKSFDLPPNDQYGHRLVVDLENQAVAAVSAPVVSATPPADGQGQLRDIVIAIDAGHGGEDRALWGGMVLGKRILFWLLRWH